MNYELSNVEVNKDFVKYVCQLSINNFVLSWETQQPKKDTEINSFIIT